MNTETFIARGGQPFHVRVRKLARSRLNNAPARGDVAMRAAQYASDNYVGCIEAAKMFGTTLRAVDQAWRRLFPGVPCPHRTPSRIERAVAFMIGHDTTVRKSAAVFGVDPRQLVEAFNAKTGAKRVLVEGELTW